MGAGFRGCPARIPPPETIVPTAVCTGSHWHSRTPKLSVFARGATAHLGLSFRPPRPLCSRRIACANDAPVAARSPSGLHALRPHAVSCPRGGPGPPHCRVRCTGIAWGEQSEPQLAAPSRTHLGRNQQEGRHHHFWAPISLSHHLVAAPALCRPRVTRPQDHCHGACFTSVSASSSGARRSANPVPDLTGTGCAQDRGALGDRDSCGCDCSVHCRIGRPWRH